jgi:hypothetical protein
MKGLLAAVLSLALAACGGPQGPRKPRLCLFVGFDVSGSFLKGPHYEDAVLFLAHYLHAHLNGLGGLDVPDQLFVGSLGGDKKDEAKTFFPIQTFQGKEPADIADKLREMFPRSQKDQYTDFNAFFEQVSATVKNKNLVLRPIAVVLLSDGKPAGAKGKEKYRSVKLAPMETLSRNVTVRLLYTDAPTAKSWQDEVPRRRIKLWTQDADVMAYWRDPATLVPGKDLAEQDKFFAWIKDNVDFPVRAKRVD